MLKTFASYAAAGAVGCAAPVLVLWIARNAPPGSNPAWSAAAVVAGLGLASGLLAVPFPARWLSTAVIVSAPLCVVASLMFAALANVGEIYWVWAGVAIGGVAASLLGGFLGAKAKRA